jgi:bacillithiol biosynthesis cysteine-adding enzyme BshC
MAVTTSVSDAVSFDRLHGFSELFVTYCQAYSQVSDYYAGDFRSLSQRSRIAAKRAEAPRARDRLADVLIDQNQRWQLDDLTRRNIESLREPESIAVVTGQQVGLFTGPLYTVYKTITALQLARQLEEQTGRAVVPIFWMAGEDHDYEEISGIHVIQRNELATVRYTEHEMSDGLPRGPVGRLTIGEQIEPVFQKLEENLLDTEFSPELMRTIRSAYAPGTTLTDAFARLLNAFFSESGLVLVSPDDRRLKQLAAPLWRREIEEYAESEKRLRDRGAKLEESYHAQIYARATNLFLLEPEGRFALEPSEAPGEFRLRGLDRGFSKAELLEMVAEQPERFSPNVALRPLMQDYLFPTAAYVGGPGEIAYFAQIEPLYDWLEIPMPVIYPRVSGTIVESKIRKVLDRYELSLPEVQQELGALFKQVIIDYGDVDVEGEFDDALRYIHEAINHLKPIAGEVDQTLVSSTEATRAALMKEMDKLKQKIIRAEKRNHDEISGQLQKAQTGLFPERQLQERYLSVLYFLNKYSPSMLDDWRESFSLDTTAHQVVDL